MIQLEQVRNLEVKVKQAVGLISRLKTENEYLKSRLTDYEVRIQELENLINSFRNSQSEIEEGINNALEELDSLESSSSSPTNPLPQAPTELEFETSNNEESLEPEEKEELSFESPVEEHQPQIVETSASEEQSTGSLFDDPDFYSSENDQQSAPNREEEEATLGIF